MDSLPISAGRPRRRGFGGDCARESGPESCSPTVTVWANDVALRDLVEDGAPVAPANTSRDLELLVTDVIELEDDRVALAAVRAWMLAEEVKEKCGSCRYDGVPPARCRGNVALSVCEVVLSFIGGSARAAVGIELSQGSSAPGEV